MPLTNAPTLTTARLTVRGPAKGDLDAFSAWVTVSPRFLAVEGEHLTPAEAWRGFLAGVGHWHWHGYGFFVLADRQTDAALGRVGILNHSGWPEPELAWHLFDDAEGKGIAFEAACAVRDWAGRSLHLPPLVSIIAKTNSRSRALAARLGAEEERDYDHEGEASIIHRHRAFDDPAALAQLAEVNR
jgi:RimJ/RimL family protein N-acetyltransferase